MVNKINVIFPLLFGNEVCAALYHAIRMAGVPQEKRYV